MEDLKNCPFCSSNELSFNDEQYIGTIFIECESCGAETGYSDCVEKTKELWNTRASQWISCENSLPLEYVKVLCFFRNGKMKVSNIDIFGGWEFILDESPIFWQPLPTPPKETTE
jgi:Lar family restriction alleviation protein